MLTRDVRASVRMTQQQTEDAGRLFNNACVAGRRWQCESGSWHAV